MGVPVRLHLFLLLLVAFMFGADWNPNESNSNLLAGTAMVTTIVLFLSLVFHELAHVFAAQSLGGHVNSLLLMPWGGNSDLSMPNGGQARAIVHLAGPFANGMLFLLATAMLVQTDHSSIWNLVNPLEPHWLDVSNWNVSVIEIICWVNFQLTLVNLLPCFPFDGAGFLRSIIAALNVDLPKYRIETGIKLIGRATSLGLIGLAWFIREYDPSGSVLPEPAWMLLLMVGISLFFSAEYSQFLETSANEADWDEMRELGYESLYNDTTFLDFTEEQEENIVYSQWLQEKQEARREAELQIEAEEEARADEILKKLHSSDFASLSDEEKSLLQRVSSRIRQRRDQTSPKSSA